MENDTHNRLSLTSLVGGICKRPAMYTGDSTFTAAIAFLSGYVTGLRRSESAADEVAEWDGFCDQLHEAIHCPKSISVLHRLRRTCQDDGDALEKLANYWLDYQKSRQAQLEYSSDTVQVTIQRLGLADVVAVAKFVARGHSPSQT